MLELDGYGHTSGADPSGCIDQAMVNYLVTLETPPDGTICKPDPRSVRPGLGKPLDWEEQPFD